MTSSPPAASVQPLFVDLSTGALSRRFLLHHEPPTGAPHALIVYVHPFAEEMNKSRRMAALQSRALAAAGFAVLQIDLLGCGDSAGESGDATWSAWVDDVVSACNWLRHQHANVNSGTNILPLWIWGLRVGCLLATQAAIRMPEVNGLVLWQPTLSGKTALQQFLRLKTVAEMISGQARVGTAQLRQRLLEGEQVHVAGYDLHPELALGMESATLTLPTTVKRVVWLELAANESATLSPASGLAVSRWQQSDCQVQTAVATGPAFWQTTETEDAPNWIDTTLSALGRGGTQRVAGPAAIAAAASPALF